MRLHEPVRRQPRDADDDAEERGQDDAEHAHEQRIEQADQQRAAVGVGGVVRDRALADLEAGGAVEEPEPEAEAALRHGR